MDEGGEAVTRLERNVPPVLAAFGEMLRDSFSAARGCARISANGGVAAAASRYGLRTASLNTAIQASRFAHRLSSQRAVALTRAAEIGTR